MTSATVVIRPRILVVDDDPSVLEALTALLAPRLEPVWRVESAASAEEALDLARENPPEGEERPLALVISDERMPGKSGTELLVALRQHPAHRDGGRIIVTGYAGLASAKVAINDAEVDRYYPKPWDAEKGLLPAVDQILARFATGRGLDRYLLASRAEGARDLSQIHTARSNWAEYLGLIGVVPSADAVEPPVDDPLDAGATLYLARRIEAATSGPAGTIRLRKQAGAWLLDGLAFQPEEAGDEVETLLLRTALLDAAARGIDLVSTDAPTLRRPVYDAIGFVPASEQAPGAIRMEIRPADLVAASAAFAKRFATESRLCACVQTGCPTRDYALARRGYPCPLDRHEARRR